MENALEISEVLSEFHIQPFQGFTIGSLYFIPRISFEAILIRLLRSPRTNL
jgi:hypothetical protein